MLDSVEAIVEALGGTAAVASLTDRGSPAVSNWKERGRIPAELYLIFDGALKRKGKTADPSLFGFPAAAAGAVR